MLYGYGRVSTKGQAKSGTVWKHRKGYLRSMVWLLNEYTIKQVNQMTRISKSSLIRARKNQT